MVPSLTTTLATPIVIVAGASKPYLPIISPVITIMASGACATPSEKGHRGYDHEGRRGHDHAQHHALHAGRGHHARDSPRRRHRCCSCLAPWPPRTPHRAIGHAPAHAYVMGRRLVDWDALPPYVHGGWG